MRSVEELTQAVSDAAEVFGPSSRMVGFYSVPLAESQLETGQIAEALEHSRIAVDIIAQHTKPQSFRYAAAIHQRGAALLAARRADEALPDLSRTTEILRLTLPAGHEVTRWFAADHGLALARAGRHRQAQALIETLLPPPGSPVDTPGEQGPVRHGRREAPRRRRRRRAPLSTTGIADDRSGPQRRASPHEGTDGDRAGAAGSRQARRGRRHRSSKR